MANEREIPMMTMPDKTYVRPPLDDYIVNLDETNPELMDPVLETLQPDSFIEYHGPKSVAEEEPLEMYSPVMEYVEMAPMKAASVIAKLAGNQTRDGLIMKAAKKMADDFASKMPWISKNGVHSSTSYYYYPKKSEYLEALYVDALRNMPEEAADRTIMQLLTLPKEKVAYKELDDVSGYFGKKGGIHLDVTDNTPMTSLRDAGIHEVEHYGNALDGEQFLKLNSLDAVPGRQYDWGEIYGSGRGFAKDFENLNNSSSIKKGWLTDNPNLTERQVKARLYDELLSRGGNSIASNQYANTERMLFNGTDLLSLNPKYGELARIRKRSQVPKFAKSNAHNVDYQIEFGNEAKLYPDELVPTNYDPYGALNVEAPAITKNILSYPSGYNFMTTLFPNGLDDVMKGYKNAPSMQEPVVKEFIENVTK